MPSLEALLHAIRERARSLARARVFSVSVIVCFALAAGANATMLGLAERAFFWQPPGVTAPTELERVWVRYEKSGAPGQYVADLKYPYVAALSAARPGAVAGYAVHEFEMRARGDAELRRVALTTPDYFTVLGARARIGRTLVPHDTVRSSDEPPVVLGHAAWMRLFGGDPGAIGQHVEIAGRAYAVVGVMPERFTGADPRPVGAWIPVASAGDAVWGRGWESGVAVSGMRAIVRERGGAPSLESRLDAAIPRTEMDRLKGYTPHFQLRRMIGEASPDAAGEARLSLWLLAMAVVVLAIAGVNVVSLFGSRAAHRAGELALRSALGASRRRLLVDAAIESALLAVVAMALTTLVLLAADAWLGGQLGLVVGGGALVSGTSLGVCAGALVLLSVVCGAVPMVRQAPGSAFIRETSVRSPGSSGAARALLIAQVTAAVLLAGEACLFAASLRNVSGLSSGIALEQLVVVEALVPMSEARSASTAESFEELRRSVAQLLPDARVAASEGGPFTVSRGMAVRTPEMPANDYGAFQDETTFGPYLYAIEPAFFDVLGMQRIDGRLFSESDGPAAPPVVVVNQTMARAIAGSASPVGRCILLGDETRCTTIVGVVADHAVRGVVEKPYRMLYMPLAQNAFSPIWVRTVYVRTPRPELARRTLEQGLAALRGRFQQLRVEPLADIVAPQVHSWRMGTIVFVGFAACALVLTAFGVYGTVLSQLALRRRELAVRKALGASVAQLAAAAAGPVIVAVIVGLVAGYAVAAGAGTLLASLLFGVEGARPTLLALALATVAVSVLAALVWPIARATGEELLGALKSE